MVATIPVSVKLTPQEKKRLGALAKRTKRSAHYVMREALNAHMDRMQSRLDLIAEAETPWKAGLLPGARARLHCPDNCSQ
jgi:predicted transcriptional regulator